MKRRDFLGILSGAAAVWPVVALAQQRTVPVIAFLSPIAAANATLFLDLFRQGLKETGFVDGQNVKIEYRWAEGQYDRLPALAAELVRMRVAVIFTIGDAAYAAKAAQPPADHDAIPIVFALGDDPVAVGLVASLNRPGGHLTGGTSFGHSIGPKKLEFLRDLVPAAKTFGLLINPKQTGVGEARDIEQAASSLALKVRTLHASNAGELEEAFATVAREHIDGLIITVDTFFFAESSRLGSLAARNAVPAIGSLRSFAAAGGLVSFNGNVQDNMRQTAIYTGRVLKGEKPADLPVLLPTKYDLTINLKAANSLGLTVPLPMLGRADEVIE
jgi:putative tryptophan/tyrosine transport system substrate-binding protein